MKPWLPLALAAGLYLWQAIEYWKLGKPGLSFAFVGYALANAGFIFSIVRGA